MTAEAPPIPHPALHQRVADSLARQGLMRYLQARLLRVAPGEVELWLPYSDKVTQQQDGFHGGAIGRVVKPGKRLIVTSAEIAHVAGDGRASACALMQQTLMAVPKAY